jgi:hypothetical protein
VQNLFFFSLKKLPKNLNPYIVISLLMFFYLIKIYNAKEDFELMEFEGGEN